MRTLEGLGLTVLLIGIVLTLSSSTAIAQEDIEDLVKLLEHGNARERVDAAEKLGRTRNKKAIPHLKKMLTDEDKSLHATAVKSLFQLGDASGIGFFIPWLKLEIPTPDHDVDKVFLEPFVHVETDLTTIANGVGNSDCYQDRSSASYRDHFRHQPDIMQHIRHQVALCLCNW